MNSRKSISVFGLFVVCGLATGCQNTIRVRVEKVVGVSSVSANGRVGRQLHRSIDNLNAIIRGFDVARQARKDFINSFPDSASTNDKSLTEILDQARELRLQCESCLDRTDEPHHPGDPRAALGRVTRFSETASRALMVWLEEFENARDESKTETPAEEAAAAKVRKSVVRTSHNLEQAARDAEPKFGGFVSTDIYPINPSDPKYAEILKSQSPIGAVLLAPFWQNTSLETLTDAKVGVSGDSAIMLVMEHPGQVRVYQVSMDPTQITRNIGMLISKATAATAKYMSGGVAP